MLGYVYVISLVSSLFQWHHGLHIEMTFGGGNTSLIFPFFSSFLLGLESTVSVTRIPLFSVFFIVNDFLLKGRIKVKTCFRNFESFSSLPSVSYWKCS